MSAPNIIPYPTVTPVFLWNWNSKAEVVINQGGTSSSKTYSILQVLFLRAATERNIVVTVVAGKIPDLKSGALRDSKNIVASSDFIRSQLAGPLNITDRVYTFRSGSIIEFKSYEDEFDARSGKRRYCYINEAQNVSREVYEELNDRTTGQMFLDYNPTMRFWAHDLIGLPGVELFISNFLHNPWVDPKVKRQLLRYRLTNPARWRVYGLGMTGEVEGVVFKNVYPIDRFPPDIDFQYGLDFGYSNHPTALVKAGKRGRDLFGQQLIYETGLSDKRLAAKMRAAGVTEYDRVVAEAADPKAIAALNDEGFWVVPAIKGPDSVIFGIELINGYDAIYLTADSTEWWVERENYTWQKKKSTGKYINKPVDAFNHDWDAFRYTVNDMERAGGIIASG